MDRNPIETLFRDGAAGVSTDVELLERFAARADAPNEAAFTALVERHSPMVLATCRQLLGNLHDAEDASQAAFLVLARRAHSIRNRRAVGGWLHGVAVRIASKSKTAAARRRKHETRHHEQTNARMTAPAQPECWDELHRQIDRLPDRLRLPIVLCYLEGLTHAEAALRLGWPLGTLESRLDRARKRLRERLGTRGDAAMLLLAAPPMTPFSLTAAPGWIERTALAGLRFARGESGLGVASARVIAMAQGVIHRIVLNQAMAATTMIVVLTALATAAYSTLRAEPTLTRTPEFEEPPKAVISLSKEKDEQARVAPTTITLGGRVVDPDGRPLPGARLWLAFQGNDWTWSTRVPQVRATCNQDGRFDLTISDDDPEVHRALRMTSGWPGGFGAIQVLATADGYGPAWVDLVENQDRRDVELRLVRDDVPIEGRLLNLEGQPLQGIDVRVLQVNIANSGSTFGAPSGFFHAATTNGDGRFRLTGVGRDRTVLLGIAGPGIERDFVLIATGSLPALQQNGIHAYVAKFEHPCKPGKTISGIVRDIDTGEPLSGITVSNEFDKDVRSTTDGDGRFRLDGLPKSTKYTLHASARGSEQPYITTDKLVETASTFDAISVEIPMARGVAVSGRLIDPAKNRPVQAWVGYCSLADNPHLAKLPGWGPTFGNRYGPSPGWHVPAMADGAYRIVVPPGRGFLVAHIQYQDDPFIPAGIPSKQHPNAPADALEPQYNTVPFELFPSHFPAVRPIEIAEGVQSASYDLLFNSGVTREGTVVDPSGKPIEDVSVIGSDYRNMNRFQPVEGSRFTVRGLSPEPLLVRTLIFRHAERRLGKTLLVDGKITEPIVVILEPTASAIGRLLDASGQPLAGIEVRVERLVDEPTRGAQLELAPSIHAVTADDGTFRIEGLVAGTAQNLRASGFDGGDNGDILHGWTPASGEIRDLGAIRANGKD